MDHRYILTGPPGTGKSTILQHLANLQFTVVEEPARSILSEQRSIGGEGVYDKNPMFNSFLKAQFGMPITEAEEQLIKGQKEAEIPTIDNEKALESLYKLVKQIDNRKPVCDEEATAIKQFCDLCNTQIEEMEADLKESMVASV